MSTKTKIKARIVESKTHDCTLTFWYGVANDLNKTYNLAVCDNCSRKIIRQKEKLIDRSRYYQNKNITKPARIWLSGNILSETKVPCDFCKGGKKIEDFLK